MERADDAFRAGLGQFGKSGTEKTKSNVLLSLGELKMRTGRPADGIQVVKEAIDLAKRLGEGLALASGHALLGQIYEQGGNHAVADKEFRLAIRLLGAGGRTDPPAQTPPAEAENPDAQGDRPPADRAGKP